MKENIEEDIKIVKKLLLHSESTLLDDESMAIENILSDYKRVLEENEDWQKAYQEEKGKQFELLRENQLAKEALKKQCDIADEHNQLLKENEKLKSDNLEYQRTQDIFDERVYHKKYLEERRAEEPNLLYPDADEIYERYYKLKSENEELKEEIDLYEENIILLQKKLTNSIYATQIKKDYLPKQKIKDKIEELNKKEQELQNSINDEEREEYSDASISFDLMDIHIRREELQDLLEEKGE